MNVEDQVSLLRELAARRTDGGSFHKKLAIFCCGYKKSIIHKDSPSHDPVVTAEGELTEGQERPAWAALIE